MTIDFYKYLFFLNHGQSMKLIINVMIFIISFLSFLDSNLFIGVEDNNSSWLIIILMVYTIGNIVWILYEQYEKVRDFTGENKDITMHVKSVLVKDDRAIQLNEIYVERRRDIQFENIELDGTREEQQEPIIYSKDLNRYIWENDFTIERDHIKEKKIKKFIKKNRDIITLFFSIQVL